MVARFRTPDGTAEMERHLEVRVDPLLGTSSRIVEGVRLQTAEPDALLPVQAPDPACPLCPERLDVVTPRLSPAIAPDGRLRVGETTLFPNLAPYSQYAAVAVFSPRHWLSLADFTPALLGDNLAAAIQYVRAVHDHDPDARYAAYNINYLYPSGGSLPHPHSQIYLDPLPTTMLRLQSEAAARYQQDQGRGFWQDLIAEEEQWGDRFVGRMGRVAWLTPFAPLGFNEVRAVVAGCETILDLTDEDLAALAQGIARVLAWYAASAYNSFNLALYSGPLDRSLGLSVNLAMVTRTALLPSYRSDAMYLERLHWEAAVDRTPEDNAAALRPSFR